MNDHLTSELRKLTTLRLPYVVLAAATVLSAVIGVATVTSLPDGAPATLATIGRAPTDAAWFLVTVVAVLAAAGEFQFRTVRTTVLTNPRRRSVLAAKTIVAASYGVVTTVTAVVVATTAGAVTAVVGDVAVSSGNLRDWGAVLGAVLVGGLWAVLASALGVLTRSSAFALTALLLWRFVGEGIAPVILRRPGMVDWLPNGAASHLVDPTRGATAVASGGLVALGYVVAACLAASWVFTHRDPA
jgi:ABC-2 type transport system permease protein